MLNQRKVYLFSHSLDCKMDSITKFPTLDKSSAIFYILGSLYISTLFRRLEPRTGLPLSDCYLSGLAHGITPIINVLTVFSSSWKISSQTRLTRNCFLWGFTIGLLPYISLAISS